MENPVEGPTNPRKRPLLGIAWSYTSACNPQICSIPQWSDVERKNKNKNTPTLSPLCSKSWSWGDGILNDEDRLATACRGHVLQKSALLFALVRRNCLRSEVKRGCMLCCVRSMFSAHFWCYKTNWNSLECGLKQEGR